MRKRCNPNRHRKHIPYGTKGYCGFGGESFSMKYGVYITDIVDKGAFRRQIKELLRKLRIGENNDE